ncbi:MAG: ABC transporter ATP-binding protein [Eubacterium sp.]|nr:ABC transporter ATP-binding protein [Eubacterium sp.]
MSETMLKIENVSKKYRLGQIGGTTLRDELQRVGAKMRGKEDPTKRIGAKDYNKGETFMALDGVSLEVKKGERVGIIGHNGAGKSTLLKLISRVTAPTGGTIGLNGRVASMLEVGTGFHLELTGRENIYMNGAILGMTKKEIDAKIEDIIDFSECRQFIDTPVKRYSSGMYVKLAFSVAAHLDSEIMIMDEVLAVGDMAFQKKCLDKMSDVSKNNGRTILYVSHNMSTIRQLCNRCIVLNHGKVIFDGDVEEAISIYSGKSGMGLPLIYNLEKSVRPYGGEQHGCELRITEFRFKGDEQAVFNRTDPIDFSVSFECRSDFKGLKLYFVILNNFGEKVGLMQTYQKTDECKANKSYTYDFRMDCSNLVDGDYSFYIDVFVDDGTGTHYSVDHPMDAVLFRIFDNEPIGLIWNKEYGSVRLNPIEVL